MPSRFPPPWIVTKSEAAYIVHDADGCALAHVYFRAQPIVGTDKPRLTPDQARRIAVNIAKLPALLLQQRGPSAQVGS